MSLRIHGRHIALTAALGLVAGLFAARLLAEEWPAAFIALYEPAGAIAAALLGALLLGSGWLLACRLAGARPDAIPLLPLALLGVYVFQPTVNLTQAWVLLAGSLLLCLYFTLQVAGFIPTRHATRITFIGVTLIAFLLYLRTLAPGVIVGDAAEFQTVLPTLGIAHPTGYPLYTLLGWLWTRIPWGEIAWRVNLLSALCGALTVGVVYLVVNKAFTPPPGRIPSPKTGRGDSPARGAPCGTKMFPLGPDPAARRRIWSRRERSLFSREAIFEREAHARGAPCGTKMFPLDRQIQRPGGGSGDPPRTEVIFERDGASEAREGGEVAVAALAALTFAFTPTWWAQCVMAEIYALGALLTALAMYFALRWAEDRRLPTGDRRPLTADWRLPTGDWQLVTGDWRLLLAAGCVGLGLAHHRTIVLLAPALLAYALLTDWRIVRRLRTWLPALGLLLAPLALYAYFPLRWPALHGGQSMTWEQFKFLVLAEGYAPALRLDAILSPDRWGIYLRFVGEQFGPAGLALAVVGAIWLAARRSRVFVLTGLFYAATVLFGLAYFVPDVSVFFIPAHLVLALWIGCGLWGILTLERSNVSTFQRFNTPALRRLVLIIGVTIAALLPLSLAWTNLPAVDLSGETTAQDWGETALSYPLGQNAVVICDVHRLAPLNYLAHGAGRRPDLEIIMPDTEAQCREIIARALAAGRPVYLARFVPGLESIYALRSVGPLVEVSPSPLTVAPTIQHPTDVAFGLSIRLLGYDSKSQVPSPKSQVPSPKPQHAMRNTQYVLRFTLYWQSPTLIGQNLHPRLRLVDAAGRVWAEEPGRPPVDGLYPTTAWPAESIVPDYHELTVPPGAPPGDYCVEVRLTPPFTEAGLPMADGSDAATLATVTVPPLTAFTRRPAHETRARCDNLLLVGYDQDETARPGGRVKLTLYWRVLSVVSDDVRYVTRWAGSAGSWEQELMLAAPFGPGETIRQETWTASVPLSPAGPGQLWLGIRHDAAVTKAQSGWLAAPADWLPLAPLTIAGTPLAGLANFEDKALLLDAAVASTNLSPGENLQVTLRWQCVGRLDKDYTVFVHLLDAGEHVYGQADAQPIYGTRPTSTWREGEVIEGDVYTFPVQANAPPGAYRLEVGLYDAATMTRLNILDADSRAVGNRVFLPQTITVGARPASPHLR